MMEPSRQDTRLLYDLNLFGRLRSVPALSFQIGPTVRPNTSYILAAQKPIDCCQDDS